MQTFDIYIYIQNMLERSLNTPLYNMHTLYKVLWDEVDGDVTPQHILSFLPSNIFDSIILAGILLVGHTYDK